jgi:hypothetical protein
MCWIVALGKPEVSTSPLPHLLALYFRESFILT